MPLADFISKRKAMGSPKFDSQAQLFKFMWDNLPHVSEISGEPLGNEMNAWFFMHVIPKGQYKKLMLSHWNIVLGTPKEHELYDKQAHKAAMRNEFIWLFDYAYELKRHYRKFGVKDEIIINHD